jgi:deazaflavin-dependent oxidoreductase (nitroreductase family)
VQLVEAVGVDVVREELADDPTVDITTTGRRTGEPRRIEIWMFDIGGRFFITGIPGRRSWLANLIADPVMTLHLKRSAHVDAAARATVVSDEATRRWVLERRRPILQRFAAEWAPNQDDLDDLVARAPMVEVTLVS